MYAEKFVPKEDGFDFCDPFKDDDESEAPQKKVLVLMNGLIDGLMAQALLLKTN
jgi:hypothetical protein